MQREVFILKYFKVNGRETGKQIMSVLYEEVCMKWPGNKNEDRYVKEISKGM